MKQNNMIQMIEQSQVEWKTLGEVAEFRRGSFPQPYGESEWYGGEEAMPFVQVVDVGEDMKLVDDTKNKISKLAQPKSVFVPQGSVIVTLQGSIGRVAITQYDAYVDRTLAIFEKYKIDIDKKYFAYQLEDIFKTKKQNARGSTIKTITKQEFSEFQIPIPPLETQKEIVRILDALTAVTSELTSELKLRQKQYQYYRDHLLSFGDDVEWKSLGEIGEVRMCKRILKEQTSEYGDIPFYKIGTFGKEANAYISRKLFEEYKAKYNYPKKGDILISASGTIGRTVIFDGKDSYFQDSNIVWIENDESQVLNKYLFYFYQIVNWNISEGGTIQRLYNDNLKKVKIPIPPLEIQAKIVEILDKFDRLTHSLSEGLPKEIELRRKQYEYYREKLLNFPK
ncbi:restriction endonuclease subunit S [Pasteurella sp. PK-2025]|uniref:restriction endonuclease subunit S n=1 Tax=Pasteurella sp. PK-2025 TaxID=3413133 RepID=UPI003C739178